MTASKVYEMGGLYKKPFDRLQSYTVLARIACNRRSGGARSTVASKVCKWADYIRNRLIGRKVTLFLGGFPAMDGLVVHAPRLPPRSKKWADYIRNRLIGRKVTLFFGWIPWNTR